jgi:hypothetical protein
MSLEVMGGCFDQKQARIWLLVSGLGAYALLKNESGLHQVDYRAREKKQRTGREAVREDRETIRVEPLPFGSEPDKAFRQAVKSKLKPLKEVAHRLLDKADLAVSLFHEPTLRSLELWTSGPREQALERSLMLLHTQVAALRADECRGTRIIRHYDLGIAPRVKDTRSGRTTNRVDKVFKGYLDVLLVQ